MKVTTSPVMQKKKPSPTLVCRFRRIVSYRTQKKGSAPFIQNSKPKARFLEAIPL